MFKSMPSLLYNMKNYQHHHWHHIRGENGPIQMQNTSSIESGDDNRDSYITDCAVS